MPKPCDNHQMGKSRFLLYPDSDPDQFQNIMGSKLDEDTSFDVFIKFQPVLE